MPPFTDLPPALRLEGHAIVSVDGMIAAADGSMPEALRNDADWRQFQAALDRSALVVLGRLGHQRHPNPGRRRLVLTSRVADLARDPDDGLSTYFNPAGIGLAEALDRLGIASSTIAITGGTRVFDYFLPVLDAFALAEVEGFRLPNGRPCFTAGPPRSILASAGLRATETRLIDPTARVRLTRWERWPAAPEASSAGSPRRQQS